MEIFISKIRDVGIKGMRDEMVRSTVGWDVRDGEMREMKWDEKFVEIMRC